MVTEEIEEFYGLTPRLNDDSSMLQPQAGIPELNDPDLADVFSYLDNHASSKASLTNTTNRSRGTQNNDANLLRLRNRPDLVETTAADHSSDDDANKGIS